MWLPHIAHHAQDVPEEVVQSSFRGGEEEFLKNTITWFSFNVQLSNWEALPLLRSYPTNNATKNALSFLKVVVFLRKKEDSWEIFSEQCIFLQKARLADI